MGGADLQEVKDPHAIDLTGGRTQKKRQIAESLWSLALERWVVLLGSPHFLQHVEGCLTRLSDESVGEEDAEVVLEALLNRLTDLLVGEIKTQILAGPV